MLNETALLTICTTLIVVILLFGIYGIIAYKINITANARQLNEIVNDYKKLNEIGQKQMAESIGLMSDLIEHIEYFKSRNL